MQPKEYIKKALRTEPQKYNFKGTGKLTPRIEHAAYGLVTESGEILDAIKKAKFYGKELDIINLIEETGDIFWYLAVMSDALGVSFEKFWEININKLKARYPEKFSQEKALNRNLKKERKILEKR